MSEGHAAPAPAAKPAAAAQVDPIAKLAELSFRLAEAFQAGNLEFNTAARQRAKAKASVDVSKIEIDFGAFGKK